MSNSASVQKPFIPQSIILVTRSHSRQDAIRALLGVVRAQTHLFITDNYAAAKQYLTARNYTRALLVIDGWSLDDKSILESNLLNDDYLEIRCLLLVKDAIDQPVSINPESNEVLVGSISGNQFIDVIRRMIGDD